MICPNSWLVWNYLIAWEYCSIKLFSCSNIIMFPDLRSLLGGGTKWMAKTTKRRSRLQWPKLFKATRKHDSVLRLFWGVLLSFCFIIMLKLLTYYTVVWERIHHLISSHQKLTICIDNNSSQCYLDKPVTKTLKMNVKLLYSLCCQS